MLLVFLINLPFGYMRSKNAPFSARWLFAVHLPVPLVFILRRSYGFGWNAVPLLILADVAGQLVGGKLRGLKIR